MTCASLGRSVGVHGVTDQKLRLDETYVEISTGLPHVDRTLNCEIDGPSFTVRVEEVKDLIKKLWNLAYRR